MKVSLILRINFNFFEMKKHFLILLVFLSFLGLKAQQDFPNSWIGNYEGKLHIYTVDSIAMKIDMKISIQPTAEESVYQWKMTYIFKGNEDVRDYKLKVVDAKKGHFVIDENNSILIDSYFRNGILTSLFKVEDSFILSEYAKVDENLEFNLIAATDLAKSSGNQKINEETIPEVLSYPVNGRQKAILFKMN